MNNPNGEGMTIVKKFELIDDRFIVFGSARVCEDVHVSGNARMK
ncbi:MULTISPECIES: hypothetical protein [Mycetohabitans]|jgi:hypothetical protein|nr:MULTISPECIES: hypothetical protein [Mycetohabitans]